MKKEIPLKDRDFSGALNHFQDYAEAKKKLDQLIAQYSEMQKSAAELSQQLAGRSKMSDVQQDAERMLVEDTPEEGKTTGDLRSELTHLRSESEIYERALKMQRDILDTARGKASHRFCEMLKMQWVEEVMTPIARALENLAAAVKTERQLQEKLKDAGINVSFPVTNLPLGDPREGSSLFSLKLEEIRSDYPNFDF